ncbi:hydantoinase [Mameliella alba]|nr:hydantoinase [Mameliella alba]OWV68620.1 hydantoinase [Mameliella alba]
MPPVSISKSSVKWERTMRDYQSQCRVLTEEDIDALEIGSGILGTGGGGNPYIGKLRARQAIREGHELKILPIEALEDDARIVALGGIGAPLVSFERLKEGREGVRCLRALEERLGFKADAIGCEEIGGQNSMEPLVTAAFAGLPVVDGDGMGRAFPEMQMTTYAIYGHNSTPSVMCDPHGNAVCFEHAITEKWHETMARACVIAQGGASVLASAPMSGAFFKAHAIPHSYTQAIGLGQAVLDARRAHEDPIKAICEREGGKHVFSGKINDLKRHFERGFNVGVASIEGLDDCRGSVGEITIQNEFLIFRRDGEMQACVPDLVVVLDLDSGLPITTEVLRYGQRVAVLALPCHELLRTQQALDVIGPAAFGFPELVYRPLAETA